MEEVGIWFPIVNSYLHYVTNQFGKKIIDSIQKKLELTFPYNYGQVFTFSKECMKRNFLNTVRYFSLAIFSQEWSIDTVFKNFQDLIDITNLIFPDLKRNILKKPSFLMEENSYSHETEIMAAKKLRIIEKNSVYDRNHILTLFIRKFLKHLLIEMRENREHNISIS